MRDRKARPRPISLKELGAGPGASEIITHMSWIVDLLTDSSSDRGKKAHAILQDIARFNSKDGKPTPEGIKIAREISDSRRYEFVGFVACVGYVKASGAKDQLSSTYIHPLCEALMLYEKGSCRMVIVGADLRYGRSYLSEIEANKIHHPWLESGDGWKN